ncbi:hypothetical protein [Rhodopirellula bahusiensis]|uniref:hypothetical protein n=1 Tax=Rhodopirellula bahusiensis TaxID=2014065 RepID=UPI0013046994|nr:hypothetical protein [Rhodopirellula bahusiensis]
MFPLIFETAVEWIWPIALLWLTSGPVPSPPKPFQTFKPPSKHTAWSSMDIHSE